MKRLLLLPAALLFALCFLPPPAAHALDYDCADFSTQSQAQGYLLAGDPYNLDGDGDGIACESLPCPCSYATLPPPPPPPPPPPSTPSIPPVEESEEPELHVYIACGLSRYARPASTCPHRGQVGAFLRSSSTVLYNVCVRFPTGRLLCVYEQEAQAGTLYVNRVTSGITGRHKVTWIAAGQRIVRYFWRR